MCADEAYMGRFLFPGARLCVLCCFCIGVCLPAQMSLDAALRARGQIVSSVANVAPSATPASLQDALQQSFAKSDVVFAGEVLSIDRGDGVVRVAFRVDDAVRGVSGTTYTLCEWSGLWDATVDRYAIGQRYLMMLHASSVAGFASPTDRDGAVPLQGGGAGLTADLRWMATHVGVTDTARMAPANALRTARGEVMMASTMMANASLPQRALPVQSAEPPVAVTSAGNDAAGEDANANVDGLIVMDLLHAWQRAAQGVSR
jgi:hypothetical protein